MNFSPTIYHGTYLIQQLNRPHEKREGPLASLRNAFCFGGGGSGLTKQAQDILDQLWSWEYMGAAEYEFGAVQKALQAIGEYRKGGHLVAVQIPVKGKEAIKDNPRSSWYSKGQRVVESCVWVIASRHHLEDIKATIDSVINNTPVPQKYGPPSPVRLKRGIRLWETLFSPDGFWKDNHHSMLGGLELDNGWLFFTRREAFLQTCELFDLKPGEDTIKPYVPPKCMFNNDDVDAKILTFLKAQAGTYQSIAESVYGFGYKIGDVVADEHVPLYEQVEKRMAVLVRRKLVTKDRKTKVYTLAPKET